MSLSQALLRVWNDAGRPSTRRLSHRTSGQVSHTTVSNVLYGKRTARWSTVSLVAEALGVDPEQFYELWREEYDAHEARRHQRSGRLRAANLKEGVTVRPGDTLVVTLRGDWDGDLGELQRDLQFLFPEVQVRLLGGVDVAVIRREETAA